MSKNYHTEIEQFMNSVRSKNSHETEFLQAVQEVAEAVIPFMEEHPKYKSFKILDRIVEPERTILFRVPWLDDKGEI
jgi:glutamate dehydrogenase (NADP+)